MSVVQDDVRGDVPADRLGRGPFQVCVELFDLLRAALLMAWGGSRLASPNEPDRRLGRRSVGLDSPRGAI